MGSGAALPIGFACPGPPRAIATAQGSSPMKTFTFHPDMTFREARRLMQELSSPEHKGHIAKLVWLEGKAQGEALTFLWDPMAERFGHQIDKEPIDTEIVDNLINEISVRVDVILPKRTHHDG